MARPKVRTKPAQRPSPVVGSQAASSEVKRVKITDHDSALTLRVLAAKFKRTQERIDRDANAIKTSAETQIKVLLATKELEQADFHQECGRVAQGLGITLGDKGLGIDYDEDTDCFVLRREPAPEAAGPAPPSAEQDDPDYGEDVLKAEDSVLEDGNGNPNTPAEP